MSAAPSISQFQTWNSTTLGSTTTLQNSQCSFAGNGVSVTGAGNNTTLQIALTFKTAFTGTKQVYMRALGASSASGYVARGTWTVPVLDGSGFGKSIVRGRTIK
jgi:hypothetical protein